jgi:hypothetical protein
MCRRLMLPILIAAVAGCAHDYAYWPAGLGAGYGPATRYPFPPDLPRGEVYATSFAFTQMDVAPGKTVETLHARLVIVNEGPDTWKIDSRQQLLSVRHELPPIVPAFVNTEGGPGPTYPVTSGQRRIVDMYYVVPAGLQQPKDLPWFELSWRIQAGTQTIAQRTVFQRFDGTGAPREPYPDYVFVGLAWGGTWWYGPAFSYAQPPVIRGYYYPPARARTTAPDWRGVPRAAPAIPARPEEIAPAGPAAPPPGGSWH